MAIKEIISSVNQFWQGFIDMGRKEHFSYAGCEALYEYLEDYSEATGEDIEYDVIAFCCAWNEVTSVEDFLENYGTNSQYQDKWKEIQENFVNADDLYEAAREGFLNYLDQYTTVIPISGQKGFIYQAF